MLVEPLVEAEVNVPGVMAILVAPAAAQLSVLVVPELMLDGLATKDAIVGKVPFSEDELDEIPEPQLARPTQANRMRAREQSVSPEEARLQGVSLFLLSELGTSIDALLVAVGYTSLVIAIGVSYWPQVQNKFPGLGW